MIEKEYGLNEEEKGEAQPLTPGLSKIALRLEAIHAGYGKKEILKGLSFTLRQGEITTLIGTNGAGKSTVLKVIMGLLRPWQGVVSMHDREIMRLPVYKRARLGLAYLLQGGEIFPSLTTRENLKMGTQMLRADERPAAVEYALALFPILKERFNHRAGLLSGGQRQALALAMVLAQRPKVLLLDEPSAGLAPRLAQEMLNTVLQLNNQLGITVLLVEQRVREALEIADRASVLVDGVIVAETPQPAQWLEAGALDAYFFGKTDSSVENVTEATN